MSTTTKNLGLFKYDIVADENVPFSITNALNNNWDILDEAVKGGGSSRNVGEIVYSSLPLTDAGLHLLDGSLILGGGIYQGFVNYVSDLYNDTKVYNPSAFTVVGSPTITDDGIASGFSLSNYITIANPLIGATKYSIKVKFTLPSTISGYGYVFADASGTTGLSIYYDSNNVMVRCASQTTVNSIGSSTANSVWEVEVIYDNGTAIVNYTKNGVSGTKTLNMNGYTDFQATNLFIGQRTSGMDTAYFKGSIDLKQFSITVDGKEVFSGSKPANYFTTESAWQSSVSTYGVCGKFVYNATDNTVRLPKVTGIIEGTTDASALGDLVASGLPQHTHTRGSMNIKGTWSGIAGGDFSASGAVTSTASSSKGWGDSQGNNHFSFSLDASRNWTGNTSNANYTSTVATTSKVQPQTIQCFVYIVIATSAKTDIQVDIDNIATDLNGKVGKNGDSVNGTYYATANGDALVINNTNITDSTGTPTANAYSGIVFKDANGVRYGKLEGTWNTAGFTKFGFNANRNVNGSIVYAQVTAWVDVNGNTFFDFPKCTTPPTTTSTATSNKVAVVVENYRNGNSWYRVYSDGWCEQGGGQWSGDWLEITLLKPYKDTNYYAFAEHTQNADGTNVPGIEKTTNILKINASSNRPFNWITGGYIR